MLSFAISKHIFISPQIPSFCLSKYVFWISNGCKPD